MKKENLIIVIIMIILALILGVLVNLTIQEMRKVPNNGNMQSREARPPQMEENTQKETSAENVDTGTSISVKEINLNEYSNNITIEEGGEYTLTGEFSNTVLINADSEVILNLNNIKIENNITAAIANISTNDLTINLVENTNNTVSDGGSSEYDGCIYSLGNLTIEGQGTLNVYGNQEEGEGIATETKNITINGGNINIECEDDGLNAGGDGGTITINSGNIYIKANGDGIDSNKNLIINGGYIYTMGSSLGGDAGIDTDAGFSINGGTVIALGSDMLEEPETGSTQKSVCFNLNSKISQGTSVTLKNESDEEILSFEADEDFSTLIISSTSITNGNYYLYQNGEKTNYIATAK